MYSSSTGVDIWRYLFPLIYPEVQPVYCLLIFSRVLLILHCYPITLLPGWSRSASVRCTFFTTYLSVHLSLSAEPLRAGLDTDIRTRHIRLLLDSNSNAALHTFHLISFLSICTSTARGWENTGLGSDSVLIIVRHLRYKRYKRYTPLRSGSFLVISVIIIIMSRGCTRHLRRWPH